MSSPSRVDRLLRTIRCLGESPKSYTEDYLGFSSQTKDWHEIGLSKEQVAELVRQPWMIPWVWIRDAGIILGVGSAVWEDSEIAELRELEINHQVVYCLIPHELTLQWLLENAGLSDEEKLELITRVTMFLAEG